MLAYGHEWNSVGELPQTLREVSLDCSREELDRLIEWQENQRDKPGRRWESLVEKAVWAVCAAVIAFLLGRVGL